MQPPSIDARELSTWIFTRCTDRTTQMPHLRTPCSCSGTMSTPYELNTCALFVVTIHRRYLNAPSRPDTNTYIFVTGGDDWVWSHLGDRLMETGNKLSSSTCSSWQRTTASHFGARARASNCYGKTWERTSTRRWARSTSRKASVPIVSNYWKYRTIYIKIEVLWTKEERVGRAQIILQQTLRRRDYRRAHLNR